MDEEVRKARIIGKALSPVVRIGKLGMTEGIVNEIIKLLKKRKVIKVKFLHAFMEENERKDAASELALKTNSVIVEHVGGVLVLLRK
jgi:RNA-binding protein